MTRYILAVYALDGSIIKWVPWAPGHEVRFIADKNCTAGYIRIYGDDGSEHYLTLQKPRTLREGDTLTASMR